MDQDADSDTIMATSEKNNVFGKKKHKYDV